MARASDVLKIAAAQLGVKENPPGSNKVKYNTWFYGKAVSGSAYPWCMAFVQWCFDQAGAPGLLPVRTASCGNLMRAAQTAGCWVTEEFQPGDVVIYDFPGGGPTDHCGIVEKVGSGVVTAIEGNTGMGNDANGGQVMRRNRGAGLVLGALRPRYEKEESKMDNTPGKYAEQAVAWAQKAGILQGDAAGNLKLHDPVTREQMMVFLYRFRSHAED